MTALEVYRVLDALRQGAAEAGLVDVLADAQDALWRTLSPADRAALDQQATHAPA